jgi:hypothetical protein
MVADLVRHDISLRKVARRVVALRQIVEKAHVQIQLLVGRAIERPHRRLGEAARRLHCPREQHQLRRLVALARPLEQRTPHVLRVGQHHRHEFLQLLLFRAERDRLFFLCRRQIACLVQHHRRIYPEVHRHQRQDDRPDAAAGQSFSADAHPAPILDVLAASSVFPAHGRLLLRYATWCR